ncbi:hypothetical protein A6C57_23365 [Fibrella sp. ES10-3-2-2]|nr:hypothetical protein A6C57_23365 [Fibrella sp. ES10-3-2-2]
MHPNFKEALDAGYLEAAHYPNGELVIHEGNQCYLPTADGANLFIKRFHAIGDVLRRHNELGLSRDVLDSSFKLLLELNRQTLAQMMRGDGGEIDTSAAIETQTVIRRIQARQDLGLDIAMVYELSSLYCLYESEDPRDYDSSFNRQKVASWVNDKRLYDFFLSTPWNRFAPLSSLLRDDIRTVLRAMNTEEILDLTRILLLKESLGLTPDTINTILSRRETLYGFDGLLSAPLSSTTNS